MSSLKFPSIVSGFFSSFLLFLSVSFLIFLGIWWNNNSGADLLDSQVEQEFAQAIKENNQNYFKNFDDNNDEWFSKTLSPYPQKMEIKTFQKNNFIFFSFLGLQKNSSVLHSVYGSWNSKTQKLTSFDLITFSIMEKNNFSVTLTNTSSIAIPLDDSFIGFPNDVKGEVIFSENLLLPGDAFVFKSTDLLSESLAQLENITYGYKAIIQ